MVLITGIVLLSSPRDKDDVTHATDFSSFYGAAQLIRQGLGSRLYDLRLQSEFESKVATRHAFYNHLPHEALLFVPLTLLDYRQAYVVWTFINVALLAAAAFILKRTTGVCDVLSQCLGLQVDWGLLFVIFLTFAPVTTCMLLGEDSVLTLLIFTATFAFLLRHKDFSAGCLLGIALFKFQLVLPVVLFFLVRRKWSFIRGIFVSASVVILLSILISGNRVLLEYARFLVFESRNPQLAGFQPAFMPNLRGLLVTVLGGARLGTTFLVAGVSLVVLLWAARCWRDNQLAISFSIVVFATLLVSFHLYNYDLTLLLLPATIIVSRTFSRGVLRQHTAIAVALAILFVNPLHLMLLLHGVYTVMCIPILCLLACAIQLMPNVAGTQIATGAAQS